MNKQLLTLSKNAISQLGYLLSKREKYAYIRLGVTKRGCNGISYKMDYIDDKGKYDELVDIDGVKLLIESSSIMYVVGIEIDYISNKITSKFTFTNPNSKGGCGCGESFNF